MEVMSVVYYISPNALHIIFSIQHAYIDVPYTIIVVIYLVNLCIVILNTISYLV